MSPLDWRLLILQQPHEHHQRRGQHLNPRLPGQRRVARVPDVSALRRHHIGRQRLAVRLQSRGLHPQPKASLPVLHHEHRRPLSHALCVNHDRVLPAPGCRGEDFARDIRAASFYRIPADDRR